jgi:pimeloyl-ACP methyl ester carboxylesterase
MAENEYISGKLVKFTTTDGLRLHGFLIEGRSRTCLIYVHGMNGNFYASRLGKAFATEAARNGYGAFLINTRGHDIESSGHTVNARKSRRVLMGTKTEVFEDSVHDIRGAIKAMKRMGYRKFILCGHSSGCQKIIFHQYKTHDAAVKALLLLAPDDDYNLNRKMLGRKWMHAVRESRKHLNSKTLTINPYGIAFSARRFISIADMKKVESRLFNYDGDLREFSKVRTPMLVVFGTRDEGALKPVTTYTDILEDVTNSKRFGSLILEGANHSFKDYEELAAKIAMNWIKKGKR